MIVYFWVVELNEIIGILFIGFVKKIIKVLEWLIARIKKHKGDDLNGR